MKKEPTDIYVWKRLLIGVIILIGLLIWLISLIPHIGIILLVLAGIGWFVSTAWEFGET